jgi:hypothetical protein
MTPKEQKLNALQFELSRRFEAARVTQAALMAEQTRQGLPCTRAFYTDDEMTAERIALRIEMHSAVSAAISMCRMRWDTTYRATPLERATMGWPAAFKALDAAKKTGNVVPLASAIEAAGRKRRGES